MKKILFAAIILAAGMFTACQPKEKDPYEGKTNPSTICQANLIAHFPFDGAATELINNVEPKTVGTGVAYEKGRRGQAFKGAAKNELVYDAAAIKGIADLKDFSFACWFKHQAVPQSQAPTPYFFGLTNSEDFWGQLAFVLDRGGMDNTDSLAVKVAINGDMWAVPGLHPAFVANRWIHVVASFKVESETLQTLTLYVNGAPVEGLSWEFVERPVTDFARSTMVLFGQWRQKALEGAQDEWMGDIDGDLDEVRLYNIALTAEEAKALYDAEITVID
ncbi:MAG: LamG domain-containing protein [Paludibacteraceae bacterium]|nr:LamG domain-containing protein [Paludibacteraceae bacterium]MBO4454432.1 LamG domain-containing protein [Paludibacteraceae bacterium]